jgi:hypothetical protein
VFNSGETVVAVWVGDNSGVHVLVRSCLRRAMGGRKDARSRI